MLNSDLIVAFSSAHYHSGAHFWQHLDVECRSLPLSIINQNLIQS
jgi:hypothetical protein